MARLSSSSTIQTQLLHALNQVDQPISVCVSGDLPLILPGLEVDGVGLIGLPLGKEQARQLIGQCSQAPYGKGVQTLVDTDVRRVWELDPDRFEITNRKWDAFVTSIVDKVWDSLGLPETKLSAHLYKLLVYEKGSFFLSHRDGEKLDRMVATLVVVLPSSHVGGELIVTHEGRRHEMTFPGAASGYEISYAGFYADCEHEVLPVKSGYRLCLIYNLTVETKRKKEIIRAPQSASAINQIAQILRNWPETEASKLAIVLDHQYSSSGLDAATLKGGDRARADVLFSAANQADCLAHLAIVTHWQAGCADESGWSNDWEEDDESEEKTNLSGYEMGDIIDDAVTIDHWVDREGHRLSFGEMSLSEDEIVTSESLDEWAISREEFEGYTGNEGMTLERWYHRAAIVVWPRRRHFQILCDAGTDAAIAGFVQMTTEWEQSKGTGREATRKRCSDFAKDIIANWSPRPLYPLIKDPVDRSSFPTLLQKLDLPDLVRSFFTDAMPKDDEVQCDDSMPAFLKRHGWLSFEPNLASLMKSSTEDTIVRNAKLLEILCLAPDKSRDRIAVCRGISEQFVKRLKRIDGDEIKSGTDADEEDEYFEDDDDFNSDEWHTSIMSGPCIDRSKMLGALLKSLVAVNAEKPLKLLIEHVLAKEAKYDLTEVQLKTIFDLKDWFVRKLDAPRSVLTRWLEACRTELETRTASEPSPPPDYRRCANLTCDCADCKVVNAFLADPRKPILRLPLAKDGRKHIHREIDRNGCDLTHVTERKGRPFTLVLTKTTASYDKAHEIYQRDKANLAKLRAIKNKRH